LAILVATLCIVASALFRRGPSKQHLLQSLFDLSLAESRVALLLAGGRSTSQICNLLGVSSNTLKSQLPSISRKTGTSRQANLVRLLAMLAGGGYRWGKHRDTFRAR
jgi:DNA-binding CsgD family transcriptional regulator